ncbi:MAG TPA: hypothetical protein PKC22_08575 [Rhodocyclaceae bacterium]|nr:hypothetical protein [Rhodocyclaceae bacterium]
MSEKTAEPHDLCFGCVYHPPNLPRQMYADEDWEMLQQHTCSFEHLLGDEACQATRKTSCSLIDLSALNASITASKTRVQPVEK